MIQFLPAFLAAMPGADLLRGGGTGFNGVFSLLAVVLIAVALSADAFFVALGIAQGPHHRGQTLRLALAFGAFQAFMPAAGWVGGKVLAEFLQHIDHWIAFGVVGLTGLHMLWEAFQAHEDKYMGDRSRGLHLLGLSVATSVDAAAIGVVFGIVGQRILVPCLIIGAITAFNTGVAVQLGRHIKSRFGFYAELGGALLLLVIAWRMLSI